MANAARVQAILSVLVIVAISALSLRETDPPEIATADAPETEFSVTRAYSVLERVAAVPHPMNSPANREVREWIAGRFRELGFEVVIEQGFAQDKLLATGSRLDFVSNVIARLPGRESQAGKPDADALLIAAHHDSVPTGPGAGDDGAAVAAALECARALVARPQRPQHDVIFLLTDGEEIALRGAKHWVRAGKWRERVQAIVNFEARGAAGPSILFETSDGNAPYVEAFADSVSDPVGSSLGYEIYRRMPNDTDFTVFRKAGYRGLNFAFIDAHRRYHTAEDTPANLDRRSLERHGVQMLALVDRLANSDLRAARASDGNRIYFAVLRSFVVHYPEGAGVAFALVAFALLAYAIRIGWRSGRVCRSSLGYGVLAYLLALGISALLALLLLELFFGGEETKIERFWLIVNDGPRHALGLGLLAASLHAFVIVQMRQKAKADGLVAGALAIDAILLVLAVFLAPGATYLLTWPLIFATLGFLAYVQRPLKSRLGFPRFVLVALASVPALVLFAPLVRFSAVSLTYEAAPLLAALVVLALSFHTPLLLAAMGVQRRLIPFGLLFAALLVIGHAILTGKVGEARPRVSGVKYVYDLDASSSRLLAASEAAFLPDFGLIERKEVELDGKIASLGKGKVWNADVEPHPIAPVAIELGKVAIEGGNREIELVLKPSGDPCRIELLLPQESRARIVSLGDLAIDEANAKSVATNQDGANQKNWLPVHLDLYGAPLEGISVRIRLPLDAPFDATFVTWHYGLPSLIAASGPRTPWLAPATWRADYSVVVQRLAL